ncbi:MAG: sulfatase [Myxococcota bacterium]
MAACFMPAPPAGAPDILLLTVDTLRPDHLGVYGDAGAQTPHIDRLATRGVRFDQAITPLPRTTPALASMLTGQPPTAHGSLEVGQPIVEGVRLAQLLSRYGYATIGLSGTPVAGPDQGLAAGFDAFEVHFDMPAPLLSARALELVDEHVRSDEPLFLWVHYVDPHFPYLPANGDPEEPCWALGEAAKKGHLRRAALFDDRDGQAAAVKDSCARLYAGEIAVADQGIGALLQSPRAKGWIAFSADHGEHFGEDRIYFEHGPSVHDAALKVPLIVAGPGVVPHVDVGLARLEDLMPTLLHAAGVPEAQWPAVLGEDLTPRLVGGEPDVRRAAVVQSGSALQVPLHHQLRSGRADKRHCLNGPRFSLCQRPGTPPRLFDRAADPGLKVDVSADHPTIAAAYREASGRWPPEQARQRAVRTAREKLTARPLLAGGYQVERYDLRVDPGETQPLSAELSPRLQSMLDDALGEPVVAGARDEGTEAALRSLGYIE